MPELTLPADSTIPTSLDTIASMHKYSPVPPVYGIVNKGLASVELFTGKDLHHAEESKIEVNITQRNCRIGYAVREERVTVCG